MKILCATDFSESSTHAANVAARWAHLLGDTLVLAHAVDLTLYPAPAEQGMYPANFEAVLIDGAEETLAREANDLRRHGVIVETQVLLGPAGIAIAAHADKVQARLIVLGSHGMQPLRRWLWGSVAEAVTQHARQPTLVVSPEALRLPGETEGLRLLVALDESAASDSAVHWVRTLRRSLPVDVTFLHYYHPVAERARLGLADTPRASVGDDVQVAGVVAERLRKRVGDLPGDGDVAWLVESNWMSVGARLSYEASKVGAHLIVLGTHQRSLWKRLREGSVSQEALSHLETPVVCVPPNIGPAPADAAIPSLRHVLVPTDLSTLGNRAVPYAYGLLGQTGGTVTLCHVASASEDTDPVLTQLRALIPRAAERLGITTELLVLGGDSTANAIVEAAERVDADVICIGSHGRAGLDRAVHGSVADTLLHRCKRPVLFVRDAEQATATPKHPSFEASLAATR